MAPISDYATWLSANGYHPRSDAHSNAVCLILLHDLMTRGKLCRRGHDDWTRVASGDYACAVCRRAANRRAWHAFVARHGERFLGPRRRDAKLKRWAATDARRAARALSGTVALLLLCSCGLLTPIKKPAPWVSFDGGRRWMRADSPSARARFDALTEKAQADASTPAAAPRRAPRSADVATPTR